MSNPGPKIVTLDIETAPLESYHWGLWEENVSVDQINVEWSILSFSAKWLGKSAMVYMDTGGRGVKHVRDDSELLKALWHILNEADVVVAQNGAAFDIKKINARLIMAGFPPYSPIRVIDTKLVAKKHFAFTSNRLQWMSKHLTKQKKLAHKKYPGFELWAACLRDDPKAWAEMRRYNCADTRATEELYLKLRPWIAGHVNVGAYSEMEVPMCPKCGSVKVQRRGSARTQTGEYYRFQCQECGGWSKSRYVVSTKGKRLALLGN